MTVKETLSEALKAAMKSGDVVAKNTIRNALASIKYQEVQSKGVLDDPEVLSVLQKEVKMRHEAIADAEKSGRSDLIENAKNEIAVLESFLPQPLSEAEVAELVKAAIAEAGATTMREMGTVMKILMPQVQGRADGKVVSSLVKQFLA